MKVLAAILLIAGLVVAIAPQFTNCEAHGGTMPSTSARAASSGMTMGGSSSAAAAPRPKMVCLWTARAALAVGIPMAAGGALLFFSRRKETRRVLGVLGALFGLFAILLPTALIGTCTSSGSVCNTTMLPIMVISGGIAVAASLAALLANELRFDGGVGLPAAA